MKQRCLSDRQFRTRLQLSARGLRVLMEAPFEVSGCLEQGTCSAASCGCPPSSPATGYCWFLLATALASILVSQGESEQKNLLPFKFASLPSGTLIFKAWWSPAQPRPTVSAKTCLSCGRYHTERTKIWPLKSLQFKKGKKWLYGDCID